MISHRCGKTIIFFSIIIVTTGFEPVALLLLTRTAKEEHKEHMDTRERIRKLFIDKIDVKVDSLGPEVSLETLGLDSLDKIELLFALEEEFQIKIDDRSKTLVTVQDVVALIDSLVAEQQPAARA